MAPGTGDVPTIEHLQDLLLESPGFTEFLLGLTTISASRLGGANPMLCAITVERNGSPATVASSDEDALPMDEKQYVYDDGPCLTALRQQHTVLVPDLGNDSRWKRYAEAVPGEGIRSRDGRSHPHRRRLRRRPELLFPEHGRLRRRHRRLRRGAHGLDFPGPPPCAPCASGGDLSGASPVGPQLAGCYRRSRLLGDAPEPL